MRSVIKSTFVSLVAMTAMLCGCKNAETKFPKDPPPQSYGQRLGKITFGDEAMKDVDIPISRNIENADGSRTIEALGEIDGEYAGFKADISPSIDRVKLCSLGKVSNRFLNVLAEKYEHKTDFSIMNLETEFVCINMGKEGQMHYMKLFYGTDANDASKYAELYLNIDEKRNVLEFHEKDPDYREAILKALIKS